MKNFFVKYGYDSMKLLLAQVAIALFGFTLAAVSSKHGILSIITSILSILFYLFIVYIDLWPVGSRDASAVHRGSQKPAPWRGFVIAMVANIPNLILAVLYTIGYPSMAEQEWAGNLCAVTRIILMIAEGMYNGLIGHVSVGGVLLREFWWTYFLTPIPCLLVSGFAYIMGTRRKTFTKLFTPPVPESDREPKKKNRFFSRKDE